MNRIFLSQVVFASLALTLGVYGIALAAHLRSARHRAVRSRIFEFFNDGCRRCSYWLIALGTLILVAGLAWQFIDRREGLLESERLYTYRMPPQLEVNELIASEQVAEGDVIAKFRSPRQEAEVAALKLKVESLEAERAIVKYEPVVADARLVQQLNDVDTEHRHLRAAIDQSMIEFREVQRVLVRDIQAKKEQIVSLAGTLDELPLKRACALAELNYHTTQLQRIKALLDDQIVSMEEHDETAKQVALFSKETERLDVQADSSRQKKTQAEEHVRELENLLKSQVSAFEEEAKSLRAQLVSATARRNQLQDGLRQDLARGEERRQSRLEQIRLELDQHRNRIDGLEETLAVKSPVSGQVVYRHPSPGTVYENDPLVIVAPPDAFRFRVRVPVTQASSLVKTKRVPLELTYEVRPEDDARLPPPHLVSRFPATPLTATRLEHDPTMALVELSCEPPFAAARDLAFGEVVTAELVWFPPLVTQPLFLFGMIPLALSGTVAFVAGRRRKANRDLAPTIHDPPAANAALRAADLEDDTVRLLGKQLALMIEDEALDPSLLATCQWALDRHGRPAARLLREGMRQCAPLREALEQVQRRFEGNGDLDRDELLQKGRLIDQLIALVEVIAPEELNQIRSPRLTTPAR
jgi:hypothetical protein